MTKLHHNDTSNKLRLYLFKLPLEATISKFNGTVFFYCLFQAIKSNTTKLSNEYDSLMAVISSVQRSISKFSDIDKYQEL